MTYGGISEVRGDTGAPERRITMTVNGTRRVIEIEPRLLLVHLLREGLALTGTHIGCDTTSCGACTVLVDGTPVKSCTMLAVQADGCEVTTVEGLGTASELDPVQEGFSMEHGLQCGFCTPGMMLTSKALLDRNPDPSEEDVRWALSGNLCRCTGYQNIVKAVQWAARKRAGAAGEEPADHADDTVPAGPATNGTAAATDSPAEQRGAMA